MSERRWAAVVVAAGRGTRFGRPKQLVELAGKPMVAWSVQTLASIAQIEQLIVTTEPEWTAEVERVLAAVGLRVPAQVVRGGEERQDSVRNGLAMLEKTMPPASFVMVHDGARPLVRADDIRRGMDAVGPASGALLAVRVVDTIKQTDDAGNVVRTLDRNRLWAAQTPQFGRLDDLIRAHADARSAGVLATDDAALLERIGVAVRVVEGSAENFKVTVPADLERAEMILRSRAAV